MNIVEATKQALKEDKAITSYKSSFEMMSLIPKGPCDVWFLIDSEGKLVTISDGQPAYWNPKASDFVSEDWKVVEYDKSVLKNAIKGVS